MTDMKGAHVQLACRPPACNRYKIHLLCLTKLPPHPQQLCTHRPRNLSKPARSLCQRTDVASLAHVVGDIVLESFFTQTGAFHRTCVVPLSYMCLISWRYRPV
jgi:hypothetical protein